MATEFTHCHCECSKQINSDLTSVCFLLHIIGAGAHCGEEEDEHSLCEKHYKEYLCVLININKVETLSLLEVSQHIEHGQFSQEDKS